MCFHLSALNSKVDTTATSSATAYRLSFSGKKSKWGCLHASLSECQTKSNILVEILSSAASLSKRVTHWLIGISSASIPQFQPNTAFGFSDTSQDSGELALLISHDFPNLIEWAMNIFVDREFGGRESTSGGFAQSVEVPVFLPEEKLEVGLEMQYRSGGETIEPNRTVKELLPLNFGFPLSKKSKIREYGLEGAARIGDLIYWIGSHGRNSDGEICEERQVFFATKLSGSGENTSLELVDGGPYKNLLSDFKTDPVLAELKLGDAIGEKKPDPAKAPKEPGAINVESLCADHERLLIGFRNPQVGGKALVIPLLNPEAVARGTGPAKFDKPILLDLGGLGIRDMAHWGDGFLVIAGDIKDRFDAAVKPSRLYCWKGGEQDKPADLNIDFSGLNPEAIVVFGEGPDARVLLLSDDGKMPVDGIPNDKHPPAEQFFRGVWLQVSEK